MHKVFISYHHEQDQRYKEELVRMGDVYGVFVNRSVDTGDVDDSLRDEAIREKIRDEYLRDSTVTIVLVGTQTKGRKHVDWEIYSSMFDGNVNKKSGILVINLPSTGCDRVVVTHGDDEKRLVYPDLSGWIPVEDRSQVERDFPILPERIMDNVMCSKISIVPWSRIENAPEKLKPLVDLTYRDRASCDYDLTRPMRRRNP